MAFADAVGGYALPLGSRAVGLRLATGGVVAVACGDPDGLIGAIRQAKLLHR